ncbi:hypothetical protein BaRGS_00029242, partial [Batillaria attramentaria]
KSSQAIIGLNPVTAHSTGIHSLYTLQNSRYIIREIRSQHTATESIHSTHYRNPGISSEKSGHSTRQRNISILHITELQVYHQRNPVTAPESIHSTHYRNPGIPSEKSGHSTRQRNPSMLHITEIQVYHQRNPVTAHGNGIHPFYTLQKSRYIIIEIRSQHTATESALSARHRNTVKLSRTQMLFESCLVVFYCAHKNTRNSVVTVKTRNPHTATESIHTTHQRNPAIPHYQNPVIAHDKGIHPEHNQRIQTKFILGTQLQHSTGIQSQHIIAMYP